MDRNDASPNSFSPLDPKTARQIRFKVRQVCGRRGLSKSELRDIEHDLGVHVHLGLARFDPTRAKLTTFIDRLVTRWLISFLRYRFAACRNPRREGPSLNDIVRDSDGDAVARHETIADGSGDGADHRDLSQRLAELMSRLPDDLRVVALLLANGTPNSVAAQLGISRREVAARIKRLREIFEAEGFGNFH